MTFDVLDPAEIESLLEDDAIAHERPAPVCCAACGAAITRGDERIEIAGGHWHQFVNPHGFVFRIGAFERADGCRLHGSPTTDWTWFDGFAWRFAACRGCGEHLGWGYEAADGDRSPAHFFGLILDRLIGE